MEQQVYAELNDLEDKHWWFCARRKYIRSAIQKIFSGKEHLEFCEIGSGTGGNLAMLSEFATVDAVEMNTEARRIITDEKSAKLRAIYDGYLPDGLTLNKQYNGVFILDVLEHVKNDSNALIRIRELVTPNGYLIATVPAYQWLWSEHDVANHHKRRYTIANINSVVESAGFEVIYKSYFNTVLFPLAVLSRLWSRIKRIDHKQAESSLKMPSSILNSALLWIFGLESKWAGRLCIPFGLSIIVIAKVGDHKTAGIQQ